MFEVVEQKVPKTTTKMSVPWTAYLPGDWYDNEDCISRCDYDTRRHCNHSKWNKRFIEMSKANVRELSAVSKRSRSCNNSQTRKKIMKKVSNLRKLHNNLVNERIRCGLTGIAFARMRQLRDEDMFDLLQEVERKCS